MKCVGPTFSEEALQGLKDDYAFTPVLDEVATVLALYGSPTRLKIATLLEATEEMCVCDIAAVLDLSVSAVSQHLGKMRAMRLVKFRRDAQTLYYAMTDHSLNGMVLAALKETRAGVE